jgi:hypothetical protein
MKEYRDERMKREGYVRPEPVKPIPIAKPAKPPITVSLSFLPGASVDIYGFFQQV